MLKNFWYACEFSKAVINQPKQIVMLNQRFVLYRNSEGQVVALKDQCPHRGAALSLGWIDNDCIRCPYHGWKFQGDGRCIDIPANGPGTAIPHKARVETYPVQEKYGLVWIFYGDLPEAERPPIPPLPEFEDPTMRRIFLEFKVNTHYTRVLENALDQAHLYIVHANSFGAGFAQNPMVEDYEVQDEDWGVSTKTRYKNYTKAEKSLFRPFFNPKGTELNSKISFYLPNITKVEVDFGRGKLINYAVHLPIDDNTTISKRIQFRNFFITPWADSLCIKFLQKTCTEDSVVSESQYPKAVPDSLSAELHIPCDALQIAYRKLRQKYLAMGWGLKPQESKSDNPNGHLAQPSSALLRS
jgi:phenylpropionate dioxygenase-like ring-hydroxylating dioxygenase large terminal subunit